MKNWSLTKKQFSTNRGFTLVELLVVIAVLGVLAAGVLTVINPLEQLARGRDGGKKSTVNQLGNAVQAYYTSQNSVYPTANATWITTLVTAGELKSAPTASAPLCAVANVQNGYCYNTNGVDSIVYIPAESAAERTRAGCTTTQTTWVVWSSAAGKTGTTCTTNATTAPAIGITVLN